MNNYFNGNGTVGFTCNVCGRETRGCSYVNGMSFCAKCYQETFGDNQITQTIITQFYNAKEQCLIDGLLKDMEENKEKYKGLTIISVEREKIVELLNKGKEFDQLKQQLAEKDKEIERLKKDNSWYSMRHRQFQKEIEDLKTELETYRPTHLKGNGQCQCSSCKQSVWTDWCIKYDGKIYCNKCFKQVETRDDKLRHQICEKIREKYNLYNKELIMTTGDRIYGCISVNAKHLKDFLDQIEKGE